MTAQKIHASMMERLANIIPPLEPDVHDSYFDKMDWIKAMKEYQEDVYAAVRPVFINASETADQHLWTFKAEEIGVIDGGIADFISPFHT